MYQDFKKQGLIFLGLLWLAVLPCFAQKSGSEIQQTFSRYQHFTMEQGLSNNSVSAIAQDDDGFIWFGTEEGLCRFDGKRFTNFFQHADGKGLLSDHVTQIVSLPQNRLLIGTSEGLCVLQTRTQVFSKIALPGPPEHPRSTESIWKLFKTHHGEIWVANENAVYVLDQALRLLRVFYQPNKAEQAKPFARDFLELPDSRVAVKFTQSQYPKYTPWQIIDFQANKTTSLGLLEPAYACLDSAYTPTCLYNDWPTTCWFTTMGTHSPGKIFSFNWPSRTLTQKYANLHTGAQTQKNEQFYLPFLLPDSLLLLQRFFGTTLILNLKNGQITNIPPWKSSLPDGKSILNFLDRDGNLWLCPRFEGIYLVHLNTLPTTEMTALNAAHKETMARMKVSEEWFSFSCISFKDKWVVSSPNGGLYSMPKAKRGVQGTVVTNPFSGYAYVYEFVPFIGDTIWINTLDGLFWYDPVHNRNGPLLQRMPELKILDEKFIYRDHVGYIWGRVLDNGVACFDTRRQKLLHFPSIGPNALYPIKSATCCTESPNNDLWFGFGAEEKYLVCYRRATGLFEKIEPISPSGFHCAKATQLLADLHGNLWIYAEQRWFIMNLATRVVQPFGKENGLVTNNPSGICMDRDGNIWLATSFGLSRYDGQTKKLRTFYQTDGLLSNVILNVALIDTAQNILFVSTDRGLCLFEPDKIGKAPEAGPTFITAIKVSENAIQLPENGKIYLPYNQNDLRIEFTGLHFNSNTQERFQYSMEREGKAANWKDTGVDHFANFLNLAPGNYVFQARTANSDGIWSDATATLAVRIYPPWWLTWTFQLSLLAVLAILTWWLYQRQIGHAAAREAEKARVQQQLAELEMRALRAQMNPHFVFNALNSVQNFILKNDTREASRYLTKFARLMRLILENSESPMVPLAREIELLRYYIEMEALRFNQRFSVDIQIDPGLHAESIAIPGMLIQPHIENAIWHGLMHKDSAGKLLLSFEKSGDDTLICVIEDNGVGRDNAAMIEKNRVKNHRSTGLSNIRNRLDLLNAELKNDISFAFQDLKDAQGNAIGTRVIVRIPLVYNPGIISPSKT